MNRFDELIEIDKSYQELITEIIPKVISIGNENNLPNFSRLTILFLAKINYIKSGIFNLFETQNTYSIKVLYRVLIEFFIKYNYLIIKFTLTQTDEVATEFIKYSKYSEAVLFNNSFKKINELLNIENDFDSYQLLQEHSPELKNISKKEFKGKVYEYDMKNMIRFINEKINKEKASDGNTFLLKLFPVYSYLSSFIHCGYDADLLMLNHSDEDVRIKNLMSDLETSLLMAVYIGSFACNAFAKKDKSILDYLKRIYEIQDKI